MLTKFNERSAIGQLAALAGIITALGIPIGGALLWAGDTIVDQKYATDADLASVQQVMTEQILDLKGAVETNTGAMAATGKSVDGLTLVVLDLQIDKIEAAIRADEREKRGQGAGWSEREEDTLRDKQKALADLTMQRGILFARVINGS